MSRLTRNNVTVQQTRSNVRTKNWVWTLNNPTDEHKTWLTHLGRNNIIRNGRNIFFIQWQEERAPTTGTRHLQGILIFNTRVTMRSALRKVGELNGIHLEKMRGTYAEAMAYVTKVESRVNGGFHGAVGIAPKILKDTEKCLVEFVKEGTTMEDIEKQFRLVLFNKRAKVQELLLHTKGKRT